MRMRNRSNVSYEKSLSNYLRSLYTPCRNLSIQKRKFFKENIFPPLRQTPKLTFYCLNDIMIKNKFQKYGSDFHGWDQRFAFSRDNVFYSDVFACFYDNCHNLHDGKLYSGKPLCPQDRRKSAIQVQFLIVDSFLQ